MSIVYLNGNYVPAGEAMVSVDDRGFVYADACYEATAFRFGRPIALARHLSRLQRGLDELRIEFDTGELVDVHHELVRRAGLADVEAASIYVQISRGVADRQHHFPQCASPTVYARANRLTPMSDEVLTAGTAAITHPDIRWGRVDIKTVGLLPNVLAQQAAVDAGVEDVILHRDGIVTEGSRTNVFGVFDSEIVTAQADNRILPGVTRAIVLELARDAGYPVVERDWTIDELRQADEVFMTSTTKGVRPIVAIDASPVAAGRRGPVTEALQKFYAAFVDEQTCR